MSRVFVVVLVLTMVLLAACGGGGGGNQGASSGATGGGATGNADNGKTLFAQTTIGRNNAPGCATCHSTEAGKNLVGPTMAGIATKADQTVKSGDYKGTAKDAVGFIHESIVKPDVYVEKGFSPGLMYQNYEKDLSAQEINDLVAYLASLK